MEQKYDVVSLGESLIDFAESGVSCQGNPLYEACPGGAPLNVMAMLDRLGHKTAYISKVGDDAFGTLLMDTLKDMGTDTGNMMVDAKVHTTLSFLHTLPDGDRAFSFYRHPGADIMLTEEEVDYERIRNAKVFHIGTLSMTDEPVRTATKKSLSAAKEAGCLISFDPNLREGLWASLSEAKAQMDYVFPYCDLLKIADNEIQFVSGKEDYDEGIRYLQEKYHIPLIFLTLGKDGSRAYTEEYRVTCPGFSVDSIEATGAGDCFCGCMIHQVLQKGGKGLTEADLKEMLLYGNAAAALVTTKKGAAKAMPTENEIFALLNEHKERVT